jgi:hypothetical protein
MYSTRQYLIFPITELSKIDYSLILETSEDTLRKSADETKTFIKWETEVPAFVSTLLNTEGPFNHDEMINILSTQEWIKTLLD